MPVTVTKTAAKEIASIIKQQDLSAESIRLRVGVKGGGWDSQRAAGGKKLR